MKKVFTFLALAFIAVCLSNCSSDNNKNDNPTKEDIVGTWKIVEVSTNDGSSFKSWTLETTTATFNANETYSGKGYFGNGAGTWKQKGKIVTTYVDGLEYIRYEVKELTSSTCTLVMSMKGSDATIWIKCIKTNGDAIGGQTSISKSELEQITSFECNNDGDMIYLKFRNGVIYTKEITKSGFPCNEDEIDYTLVGEKIYMSFYNQTPNGTIRKITFNDGKIGIVLNLNGSYGIASWLSKTFKESDYVF